MPDDLRERLRLVYEPWIDAAYNGKKDVDSDEVSNEESRSDNSRFNGKAARRN